MWLKLVLIVVIRDTFFYNFSFWAEIGHNVLGSFFRKKKNIVPKNIKNVLVISFRVFVM